MDQVTGLSLAGRIGRRWFKWRGVSPVPLFILVILLPPDFLLRDLWVIGIVFGSILAEGLRIWAVGYAGSATRTRGDRIPELVSSGPFRYVRNPLYIALSLLLIGIGIVLDNIWIIGMILPITIIIYGVILHEERYLTQKFGEEYQKY